MDRETKKALTFKKNINTPIQCNKRFFPAQRTHSLRKEKDNALVSSPTPSFTKVTDALLHCCIAALSEWSSVIRKGFRRGSSKGVSSF